MAVVLTDILKIDYDTPGSRMMVHVPILCHVPTSNHISILHHLHHGHKPLIVMPSSIQCDFSRTNQEDILLR